MSAPQAHSAPAAELQRQMATAAAQQGARAAADRARTGFFEVQAYISENPTSLKILCFCSGLALIAFSLLGLFNPFDINIIPKDQLCNLYNVFFGVIICVCDGKALGFWVSLQLPSPSLQESWLRACGDLQVRDPGTQKSRGAGALASALISWHPAPFFLRAPSSARLTSWPARRVFAGRPSRPRVSKAGVLPETGRSFFYLYVGTMTLLARDWLLPGGILDFFNRIIGIALCVLAMLMLARDWCAPLCCKDSYNQMGSGSGSQV
ncbi:unnamed protein product [Symbiodinium sp. CCMP2592]|nr:unnamed protein product [Symbiodinium sp. CCMP2592]